MKWWYFSLWILLLAPGCEPEVVPENEVQNFESLYFPLAVGNFWIYAHHWESFDDQTLETEKIDYLDTLLIIKDTLIYETQYFYFNKGYWIYEDRGAVYQLLFDVPVSFNYAYCLLDTNKIDSNWTTPRIIKYLPPYCNPDERSYRMDYHRITRESINIPDISNGASLLRDEVQSNLHFCASAFDFNDDGKGPPFSTILYAKGIGQVFEANYSDLNTIIESKLISYSLK